MDLLRLCVLLTLCVTMITQVVFSAPDFSQDTGIADSQFEEDPDTTLTPEQGDVDDSSELYSRVRRQFAQMNASRDCSGLSGSRRRNCMRRYSRPRTHRHERYHAHRRMLNLRNNRGGRVRDW